jgi:four helix bundle protein
VQSAEIKMQNLNSKPANDLKDRSYDFSLKVISLCDELPQKKSAWVIAGQLIRAATSIGANIVEVKASSSRLEFKKFFEIALKSANETVYWLSLLQDSQLISQPKVNKLIRECQELGNMLGKSVITLKRK